MILQRHKLKILVKNAASCNLQSPSYAVPFNYWGYYHTFTLQNQPLSSKIIVRKYFPLVEGVAFGRQRKDDGDIHRMLIVLEQSPCGVVVKDEFAL